MRDYQDVEIKGILKEKGRRVCSSRWDIIKPHLRGKKTIFDIGSNLGYFTVRIAQEIPDTIVASFEMHKPYAFEQREILIQNAIKNVILCCHEFNSRVIEYLWKSHEAVDSILLLSVLHYYESWEVESILEEIKNLTPEIIVEFPRPEEKSGGLNTVEALSPFNNTLKKYFQRVELIGESDSFMRSDIKRDIFKASNPGISRLADDGHRMSWNQKEDWKIDQADREWIPGLGFQNLAMWYIIYPSLEWFLKAASLAYSNLKKHGILTDMTMKNLLFRPNELTAIDYSDKDTLKLYAKSLKEYSSENWYDKGMQALEDQIRNIIKEN